MEFSAIGDATTWGPVLGTTQRDRDKIAKKKRLVHEPCGRCGGTGSVESYPWFAVPCPGCNGSGLGRRVS